jgi:hypothetical protein
LDPNPFGLFVGEFCRKMKSTTDALRDPIPERVLVLNVVWGLNSCYEALRTLITHQKPLPTFLQVKVYLDVALPRSRRGASPSTPAGCHAHGCTSLRTDLDSTSPSA